MTVDYTEAMIIGDEWFYGTLESKGYDVLNLTKGKG